MDGTSLQEAEGVYEDEKNILTINIFLQFSKVKLTVHAEVMGGTVLQQVFVVEYVVNHQMCDDCHRSEAQDYWRASVNIRRITNR